MTHFSLESDGGSESAIGTLARARYLEPDTKDLSETRTPSDWTKRHLPRIGIAQNASKAITPLVARGGVWFSRLVSRHSLDGDALSDIDDGSRFRFHKPVVIGDRAAILPIYAIHHTRFSGLVGRPLGWVVSDIIVGGHAAHGLFSSGNRTASIQTDAVIHAI